MNTDCIKSEFTRNGWNRNFFLSCDLFIYFFSQVSSTLRVNNVDLLTLSFDPVSSSEALFSVSGQMLVNITYDAMGRPVLWVPVSPLVQSNVSYDHWGHIIGWTRGNLSEQYEYDRMMRLKSVTYADSARITYDYKDEEIIKVTNLTILIVCFCVCDFMLECFAPLSCCLYVFHIFHHFVLQVLALTSNPSLTATQGQPSKRQVLRSSVRRCRVSVAGYHTPGFCLHSQRVHPAGLLQTPFGSA